MSFEKDDGLTIPIRFKSMTCQATDCIYNEKPSCSHDWAELDESGTCIFIRKNNMKGSDTQSASLNNRDGKNIS